MSDLVLEPVQGRSNSASFINDPKVRSIGLQLVALILVILLGWMFAENARDNLAAQKIATGFGFLDNTAGFGISQTLIPYSETSTYGRAFLVGLLNTILVAVVGIFLATIIGFLVGIGRLSKNFVVRLISTTYVEVLRNLPPLFQILFWYLAVLSAMPSPRQSISVFGEVFISNRGLIIPRPLFGEGTGLVLWAFGAALLAVILIGYWARGRREETGQRFPMLWVGLGILVLVPLAAMIYTGFPITFERPELKGFNFAGGVRVIPEFVALTVALATYTAAFIAENVRSGIMAVSHGQTEAAHSLGLRNGQTLRLVVIPQAMRVIIPPLTNQYLNLTKNSSLAVGIGYPDLVAVFAGTSLNQTGQAIEIIAITMGVYLVLSILTSLIMNAYNKRIALVER
ncbi:polar amino acid ABC transporter, inner membrane subunit [Ancylobacter novellus DSM 506]|uniref:Polar amino acid ABC transporter, inner membrane subunit n=1 Tax=Ancylobacter novellus (strain ATCC 8093 / DSM 506 / JCM 20403 / CCM 1077 / IAM 12100 / NBRC 12443 / NCIMB 10456) TaxID=639283 RepID=D7A903_ANCN5|nr:amino acid ABC transporter permease [Ancylobacter novellus]ADH88708.1 polar amino acid ABC transporter, inner membrane subunit [Ancylobacter novellus DSM 506]